MLRGRTVGEAPPWWWPRRPLLIGADFEPQLQRAVGLVRGLVTRERSARTTNPFRTVLVDPISEQPTRGEEQT